MLSQPDDAKGGCLSVRFPAAEKPIMLIGQDESTFHQLVFSRRGWKTPMGHSFIQPKGDGEMLMVSAFQSREFGLGLGDYLTEEVLIKINHQRKGNKYVSEEDAFLVRNDKYKNEIKTDPCLRYFNVGINKDGYWNNSHMKIQLEDVCDCLSVIFPSFEFVFLFDQSSGHIKKRNDGLVASRLNVSYGGGSPSMHDTIVEDFGAFPSILSLGDTQQLSFQESDIGPFWMDAEARLNSKFDTNIGGTTVWIEQRLSSYGI